MHRETGSRTFADEFVGDDLGRNDRLERTHATLDWGRIGTIVGDLHSSGEGRKAYPPLVMLKAMPLQHPHPRSNTKPPPIIPPIPKSQKSQFRQHLC